MINNTTIVGRLTKDVELRFTPSGVPTARFTVAVNRPFSNGQGEREADFIPCVAWRKQAENLANFMKKGSLIGVVGRIQTGSFEGQDGKRVYTVDVIADAIQFLEPRSNGSESPQGGYNNQTNTNYQTQPQNNTQGQQGGQQTYQQTYNPPPMDADPFASNKGPIEINESDLPF